jgi:hypothetical protein
MEVPKDLEIKPGQTELTQEQEEWLNAQASKETWPFYLENPRTAAKALLPKGASLADILDEMFNYP